jgi:NADH:ubiquinone oxidoreductase subunit 6 (subunit J)
MFFELSTIALCAILSVGVSLTSSPFMALMYAVLLFINASVLLLVLGFEFLALVNLLVYVGALAVLFLFVIMLLEIPSTQLRAYQRGWSTLALVGALASVSALRSLTNMDMPLKPSLQTITFVPAMESISNIGTTLYVHYADVLILNSMVLTIALFGALVLAHTK